MYVLSNDLIGQFLINYISMTSALNLERRCASSALALLDYQANKIVVSLTRSSWVLSLETWEENRNLKIW